MQATTHGAFRLRPLGIGDILDDTFKLYRQNFVLFVGIFAVILVPEGVVQILASLSLNAQSVAGVATWAGLSFILSLITIVSYVAVVHAISERYLGRAVTIGQAYSHGLPRVLPFLGASILAGILALLPAVTVIGMIATIYLGVRWTLITQAAVIERKGVRGAMGRSWGLTAGYWGKTFFTLLLLFILVGVIELVVGGILSAALGAIGLATGNLGQVLGFGSFIPSVGSIVSSTIVSILLSAILPIGTTVLYYDLRVRKEGYDLELMAQDLGEGPTGTERP